jgi:hypothetical protein
MQHFKTFLFSGAALLGSYFPAHAALELYADFETPAGFVSASGGSQSNASFAGAKAPVFVDGAPASLTARSKKSLRLGGDGFFYFRETDAPELSEAWSINAFVKFDPKTRTQQTLVGRSGSWFWFVNLARNSATFAPAGQATLSFPLPANFAGKWAMLTLVKSGTDIEFFINGKSQGKKPIVGKIGAYGSLYVGAASSQSGYALHAALDDLSVWSQALDAAQIQKLFSGTPVMEIAAQGRLKRVATPPITAQTLVYHLASTLNARHAVIALPENGERAIAEKVRDLLARAWGVTLQIRSVENHDDGKENVILLGAGMAHPLSRELAGNTQIQRNIKGSELRIFPEALDWQRGVIYLGGRNEAEVLAAAQKLVTRFPKPDNLTFTIQGVAPGVLPTPQELTKNARDLYAGRTPRKSSTLLKTSMQQAYDAYLAMGDEAYVQAFREMLKLLADNYQASLPESANMPPSFEFYRFPQFIYLLENSPNFTDEDRRRAGELMRVVAEGMMDSWELVAPAQAYAVGKNKYFTNHYAFASRSTGNAARYLLSRFKMDEMNYFLAVAEHTLNAAQDVPLSPEDAGGYQYLVYRIFTDYMLAAGKLDNTIFTSPKYLHYMDYAKASFNHLGYTAGYGDANPVGMRGGFVPLRENMEFTGDPESAAILSLVGRFAGDTGFYADSIRDWGIPLNLPLPHDPRFLGLRTFDVDQTRAQIMGMASSPLPKLDKAFFRSSWNPDNAEFLAINGLNGAPHGHDDAIGVSQYLVGPHLWLFEGDYIRRAVEDHNLVSVIRNGQAAQRQRNRIPAKERFAQIVGQTQSADRQSAALTLLLESNNGVNYYRHIGWQADGGLWIIDELEAMLPGEYRFASRWRTTGQIGSTPQGAMVAQKADGAQDKLNHFSIAEGSGATHFGYSEFERSHGRGTGNLAGFNLSDGVTRTILFWKEATLQPGQRVFFANYFRVVAGGNPQLVEVQKLADNAFAVGSGAQRQIAVIGEFGGVAARALFAGPRGTLAIEPKQQDAAAIAKLRTQNGAVVSNTKVQLPANVASAKLKPLREFSAEISAVASGRNHIALGLANGEFYLLKPDGSPQASAKFPSAVSTIGAVNTAAGELWAVGTRPVQNTTEAAGGLHLLDASGKVLWSVEIPGNRGRQGTINTIFEAHLDGPAKPISIIVGPESWRYTAFDLNGKERWYLEASIHGAMAGAAGDLNGDGRDEIYAGGEYYYHPIFSPDGKLLSSSTTSPRNNAVLIGDPDRKGIKRIFAARSDGYLYSQSLDKIKAPDWSANIGGPAHGLAMQNGGVIAATVNGTLTQLDGNGRRVRYAQLPVPLTDLLAQNQTLWTTGLDGRIYQMDAATLQLQKVWETGGYSVADLHFPKLVLGGGLAFAVFGNQLYLVQ